MEPDLNSKGSHIDSLGGVIYYGYEEMRGGRCMHPRGNLSSLTWNLGFRRQVVERPLSGEGGSP
jgi:hypothetical protein